MRGLKKGNAEADFFFIWGDLGFASSLGVFCQRRGIFLLRPSGLRENEQPVKTFLKDFFLGIKSTVSTVALLPCALTRLHYSRKVIALIIGAARKTETLSRDGIIGARHARPPGTTAAVCPFYRSSFESAANPADLRLLLVDYCLS